MSVHVHAVLEPVERECGGDFVFDNGSVHQLTLIFFSSNLLKIYSQKFIDEYDKFTLASCYMELKEYDRAAFFLQECSSSKAFFLHMYSRYMSDEKRKVDNASDSIGT